MKIGTNITINNAKGWYHGRKGRVVEEETYRPLVQGEFLVRIDDPGVSYDMGMLISTSSLCICSKENVIYVI